MGGGNARRDGSLGVGLTYEGEVACVTLAGELDLAHVRRFDAIVGAAFVRADHCRVDLSQLRFLDSTGVRALLRARRRASETGMVLEFVNPSPAVARLLAAAGLSAGSPATGA